MYLYTYIIQYKYIIHGRTADYRRARNIHAQNNIILLFDAFLYPIGIPIITITLPPTRRTSYFITLHKNQRIIYTVRVGTPIGMRLHLDEFCYISFRYVIVQPIFKRIYYYELWSIYIFILIFNILNDFWTITFYTYFRWNGPRKHNIKIKFTECVVIVVLRGRKSWRTQKENIFYLAGWSYILTRALSS